MPRRAPRTTVIPYSTLFRSVPVTGYQFQLVAFRGTLNANVVFGAFSNGASGTTPGTTPPETTNPRTVTDLALAGVTDTSVTLAFTEVSDGTGLPASDYIRWA